MESQSIGEINGQGKGKKACMECSIKAAKKGLAWPSACFPDCTSNQHNPRDVPSTQPEFWNMGGFGDSQQSGVHPPSHRQQGHQPPTPQQQQPQPQQVQYQYAPPPPQQPPQPWPQPHGGPPYHQQQSPQQVVWESQLSLPAGGSYPSNNSPGPGPPVLQGGSFTQGQPAWSSQL